MESFWYESNSCWGWVQDLNDLNIMCNHQVDAPNGMDTPDEFLDRSYRHNNGSLEFGTRVEHYTDGETLREYLEKNEPELLKEFLNYHSYD